VFDSDDEDGSNDDADDEDGDDDNDSNSEDDTGRTLVAPPNPLTLSTRSSPTGGSRIQHRSLPTSDARPVSISTAPAQAVESIKEGGIGSNSFRALAHNWRSVLGLRCARIA
jgi:hypothetical protein